MTYLLLKAMISGLIIAAASEVARRSPGIGALIVALPVTSLLTFIWLWRDTGDSGRIADMAGSAFWFIIASLPMFVALPALLRAGVQFWVALVLACALTILLYFAMIWAGPRLGLKI